MNRNTLIFKLNRSECRAYVIKMVPTTRKIGQSIEDFWRNIAIDNADILTDAKFSKMRFRKNIFTTNGMYFNKSRLYIPSANENISYEIAFYS